jgi:ribosome-associated protein
MIDIAPGVGIPEHELTFTASRSGGPGGQNVNKVSSRIELRFDLEASPSLTPEQKRRIVARLGTRITKEGVLRVVASASRSQYVNREAAVARFQELLAAALRRVKPRFDTRVPSAEKKRRIESKKARGQLKRNRSVRDGEE